MLVGRAFRRMAKCSLTPAIADSANQLSTYSVDQATNIKWYEGGVSRRGVLNCPVAPRSDQGASCGLHANAARATLSCVLFCRILKYQSGMLDSPCSSERLRSRSPMQGTEGEEAGAAGLCGVVHGAQRQRQEHSGVHGGARASAPRVADGAAGRRQRPPRPQQGASCNDVPSQNDCLQCPRRAFDLGLTSCQQVFAASNAEA